MNRATAAIISAVCVLGPFAAMQAHAQPEAEPEPEPESEPESEPATPPSPGPAAPPTTPPSPGPTAPQDGSIPDGFEDFKVVDLTIGMRDDVFTTIEVDPRSGTVYVATAQGRLYKSTNNGADWDEWTILPEVKVLFGYAGQLVLLGHLRDSAAQFPRGVDPFPLVGSRTLDPRGFQLLNGGLMVGSSESSSRPFIGRKSPRGNILQINKNLAPHSLNLNMELKQRIGFDNKLQTESERALSGEEFSLGAGLSGRAPRLAMLLARRGRPIATMSLQRLLVDRGARLTYVRRVVPDPADSEHLLAATLYGLYQSFDGGRSWARMFPGLTQREREIKDIVFDPADPHRVYMSTSRGLYVSDDSGLNWTRNTDVPELFVNKIAVDPEDSRFVYVATSGGVFRSSDRGQRFVLAYWPSLPLRRDVWWITIDPFNSNRAFLGTHDGVVTTDQLKTSLTADWHVVGGLRTVNLSIPLISACSRHPGHLYMVTKASLPIINYGANGPEAYIVESWNHGESWRILAGNQTQGDVRWFTVDPRDPDTLWVAFERAIVRIQRTKPLEPLTKTKAVTRADVLGEYPRLGQVLSATLTYHGVEMTTYAGRLAKLRHRNWLPSTVNLTFFAGRYRMGGDQDDRQFADDRFLFSQPDTREWRVMVNASWNLSSLVYHHQAVPMQRIRVQQMNDEVRNLLIRTVHRNYGELQRLVARQRLAESGRDLYTRLVERSRIDALKAIINAASGGYLDQQMTPKETR